MGYMLNLVKYWVSHINDVFTNPKAILIASLKKDKVLFGMLFGGYVGIFRVRLYISMILQDKYMLVLYFFRLFSVF